MAFGNARTPGNTQPMTEINIIPLVDVMLVLLVIFIITAPLLTNAVKINLPQASSMPNVSQAANIQLAIDAKGQEFWNGEPIDAATLATRLHDAGQQNPVPELHLHADRLTTYDALADVMTEASKAGVTKIGFVTQPQTSPQQ